MSFLKPNQPCVILAPMEGVTDAPMREYLTRTGAYDYCVTEFIRVSMNVVTPKVFRRYVPELLNDSKTSSGIPVQVQLLGGDPDRMAASAIQAIELGAKGIDINFGCPAPTVNRHDGGATILKYPDRLEQIVRAIRDAVPSQYPVSAKIRLGFSDPETVYENSKRIEQGGASWLGIHGRTKTQGYTPPAYWEPIGRVRESLSIPVIANGEIWTLEDFKACREQSGAIHYMLGRGALASPNLALEIRKELGLQPIFTPDPLIFPENTEAKHWAEIFDQFRKINPSEKRIKQWSRYLSSKRSVPWWNEIKTIGCSQEIVSHLRQFQD